MFHNVDDATRQSAKTTTQAWYLDSQLLDLNAAKFYLPNEIGNVDRAPVICANYQTISLCNHSDATDQYPYGSYDLFNPCGGDASKDPQLCICATPTIKEQVFLGDYAYTTWCSVVPVQGEPHEPDQNTPIGSKLLLTAVHAYDLVKGLAFQQES